MLISGIHSRPKYAGLRVDRSGTHHIILSDTPRDIARMVEGLEPAPGPTEVWTVVGACTVTAAEERGPDGSVVRRAFRSRPLMFDMLGHRLARESMGLRLYAIGEEAFLWDVAALARSFGVDGDEIQLDHAGSERRRVFCVHCRAMTENVRTNIVACVGCGAHLTVRDHFSKRLAAFMGVQADAEVRGDLPPVEEIFR
ncbi:dimethylamine monooxygenase subunit DmmA family protein [Chthonobacter rhizosphaerae]|uniref:dimethylamine monooxygenase subunit DmmA family protein n=1 Tax=Chthonobacter rhizosphaerae TaxID=2735553 RepID=UPI0015EFB752